MVAEFQNSLTGEELVRIYAHLLHSARCCRAHEPEEVAQEALFRLLKNLRAGICPENALAYAHTIAQRVLQEARRRRRRELPLEFDIVAPVPEEQQEALLRCLELCKRQCLSRSERRLLQGFDEADATGRKRLAQKETLTRNALGIKVYQLRLKLRACVETCMKEGRLEK